MLHLFGGLHADEGKACGNDGLGAPGQSGAGVFDFLVVVEGSSMKEVAYFVGDKLSSHEMVTSTATHFILNAYKENHVLFEVPNGDERINDLL